MGIFDQYVKTLNPKKKKNQDWEDLLKNGPTPPAEPYSSPRKPGKTPEVPTPPAPFTMDDVLSKLGTVPHNLDALQSISKGDNVSSGPPSMSSIHPLQDRYNPDLPVGVSPFVPQEDTSGGIMSKIEEILGREKAPTEGRFVNEYSPEQLAALAQGLLGAGNSSAALYEQGKGDINALYNDSLNRRATTNTDVAGKLTENLSNLGLRFGSSDAGKGYAQDAQFLNQVANQNRATDLSFNDKLGTLTQALGQQLAAQARQGLLTENHYIPGDPGGLSEADKFRLSLLQDQLNSESDLANQLKITESATETSEHLNPAVANAIGNIADPQLQEEAARIYDLTGDPNEALKYLAGRGTASAPKVTNPLGSGWFGKGGQGLVDAINSGFNKQKGDQNEQDALLIEIFRQLAPTWGGQVTKQSITDSSKRNLQ